MTRRDELACKVAQALCERAGIDPHGQECLVGLIGGHRRVTIDSLSAMLAHVTRSQPARRGWRAVWLNMTGGAR